MNTAVDDTLEKDEVSSAYVSLQPLIWPEQGICTERDMYVRLNEASGLSAQAGQVFFRTGGLASFDTWFNLFNVGKWNRVCALSDLCLALTGEGLFEISVFLSFPERSWERLVNEVVPLSGDTPVRLDLSHLFDLPLDEAVLFFEMKALGRGRLTHAAWETRQAPRRTPDLMLSITTFRREAAVGRTVRRFARFRAESPLGPHIRLLVVDNGQSAGIEEGPGIRTVPNANLGGAGGFARGLLEAQESGASHCLFMDDDASLHMASLERTWMLLAYASDPATAVAGAMINATHKWAVWENGAIFDRRCLPLHMGTDLRRRDQAFGMEFATTAPAPDKFYGGWWYFAFPVDRVRHLPFPFFVRGDDVSFSLVHDFDIVTLNGVVSFQDSFTDKESPLTWYLDLRSHLAHHLSLPSMRIGAPGTFRIAAWFYLRNVLRLHYDTLSAVNLALEDVLRGPEFFAENADMAQRRADIKALTRTEAWGPADRTPPPDRIRFNPHNRLTRMFLRLTLSGYLLPFFRLYGNRITLKAEQRGNVRDALGAARITYLDASRRNSYTVTHSKRLAFREGWRLTRNGLKFLRRYDALCAEWQAGYERLTAAGFWSGALDLQDPARAASAAPKYP